MAKRTIINSAIPSIDTQWDDGTNAYSGKAVEDFLKSQLSSKIGYAVIPQEKDTDGYYHIWGFASQSAYTDYMTDTEANASLRLLNVAIPLLEEQGGVSNIVTLTRNSAASLVTSKAVASVNVSYLWQQYNPITKETTDQDEDATIVVSCRTQNSSGSWGAWDSGKEFTVNIQSGQTKTIDLSSLLTSDATYQVRLVATGETSGISASPVTMTIVYSNVSATYDGSIATAYKGGSIQLPFRITGSVQKQLRVKINGYTKSYTLGTTTYTDNTYGAVVTQTEFGLARGAVKAEVWVAFGDSYSAETEHQEFQFIYIPEGDTVTTPILAVTDVVSEFENWTRTTIFRYAIYNPLSDSATVRLTLQDSDTGQIYIQKEQECVNGTAYEFDENFAMEYDGDEQPTTINAQMTFTNTAGVTYGNSINFTVDNTENFAPTKGANVIVSAEKQSITIDDVSYELNDLLSDTEDTNSGWSSNAETDATGASVNVPVLSIAAGNRFTLPYELFDENTGHNNGGVEGSITMEFDIKVKNIVGDSAIVDASADFNGMYTGLKFYPTRAVCLSQNNYTEELADVNYQEEEREHIAVNIIRNLRGEGMNLVRIYVNGISNRSFIYTDDDYFIPIGEKGAQSIVIGSDEADVDIYGIRIYKGQQLGSTQIQNDYMAGMPTIEDKKLFKRYNSIYNGSEIGYDLCNAMGLNTILRKIPEGGHYPSRENQSKQKNVTIDVRIYSERGNADSLDMKHSGTFVGMTDKGQGTSAKGYYWWNITDGFEDDVEIELADYTALDPTHYTADGKYYRKISYFNSLDGVSQVYASKYELEDGRGGITKLVGKTNYASPMQSHKLGAIWMYDELWQTLVNDGSDDRPILQDTHATCYEKPFLCFYQIGNGTPIFCGLQTWGSGKGDKKTFGYDKKKSPGYICISGADNGAIAALFQMPWDVSQNADGAWEGNIYAKSVTINTGDVKNGYCYKSGTSDTLSFEVEIGNKYDGGETDKGVLRIEDEAKGESETTLFTTFAEFANFIFACSPLLKPYAGTEAQLIADSANLTRDHQYWLFNSSSDRYNVYYYNPATSKFEKAFKIPTAWGSDGRAYAYGSPKLTEQLAGVTIAVDTVNGTQNMALEDALSTLGTSDMNVVNDCFSKARVAYFAAHVSSYLDIKDAIYHQCSMKLLGGTDNRTKNTYYFIDPSIDLLVRFKQDDLDTIFKTDNQGRQTKPYFVLEHTKDANGSNYWNGENNVLYTLIERAYPERMRTMMRNMFAQMAQIAGSVENYFQIRFYWVQKYFPAVAYNETSRLLYEVAQVKMMNGLIDVSQDPITQAVGDQLECEKQFMNQRLPMLMSWCEYETGGDGTLSFRSVNNVSGQSPTYDIEYTAYQYIYPKLAVGGYIATLYAKVDDEWVSQGSDPYLCAPGETVRLVIASTDSNTQFTLRWMHYAKSIGNLGTLPCGEDGSVTITGKRLRKLECWSEDEVPIEFHPTGLVISNCRNLEEVNLTNASAFSGTFSADLPRLRSLLLSGSAYTRVAFPKTSTLTAVTLPGTIQAINVDGQPNLASLSVSSLTNLRNLYIVGKHQIQKQTQPIVQLAYAQATNVNDIQIDNVSWTGLSVDVMMWLQKLNAKLTGTIGLTGSVTFANKVALATTYGDIDSTSNALYLSYTKRSINSITVSGSTYLSATGTYQYEVVCSPSTGNDIAIKDGKLAVVWELDEAAKAYGSFVDSVNGILKVTQLDESGTDTRYMAQCTVTKTAGATLTSEFQICFYRRIPKIGDFAYADGTFDDQYFKDKTLVGLVYKIDEMWQGDSDTEPTVFTGYNKPSATYKTTHKLVGYQLNIDCKEYVPYKSTDGAISTTSTVWGLYPSTDSNGHTNLQSEIMAATSISSIFDLTGIVNITATGLSGGTNDYYITTGNYIDIDTDDGFKDYSSGSGCVTDWNGKAKTLAIVKHANQIISSYLLSDGNESVATNYEDSDGVNHEFAEIPTTVEELANAMEILYKANNNLTKYQQFLYPAGYGCYLYQPAVKDGETLDPQYTSTHWYLPACGEEYRQYSFFAMSRTGGMGEPYSVGQNTSPAASVIDKMITDALASEESNEINLNVSASHVESRDYTGIEIAAINRYFHNLIEAEKPIYSMAIWRALVASSSAPFTQHSTGYHWTSTELSSSNVWYVNFGNGYSGNNSKYNAFVVRPAVAYQFFL
jgi:hypothetical protein